MNEMVQVKDKQIVALEWKGQRVITTALLAEVYGTDENNIKNNFNNHKDNFIEGKHYYFLQGKELREFKNLVNDIDAVGKRAPQLYLWTRRGASRHCKILDTEKAWIQFDALEENYYNPKRLSEKNTIEQILENPDFGIKLLTEYKKEKERNQALELKIEEKDKKIEEMKPKASYYDLILQCKDLISATVIAQDYGMTAQAFNKLLQILHIQYKLSGVWVLYRDYKDQGYTGTKTYNYADSEAVQHAKEHTYWTQKGRKFLYEKLKDVGYLPVMEQ